MIQDAEIFVKTDAAGHGGMLSGVVAEYGGEETITKKNDFPGRFLIVAEYIEGEDLIKIMNLLGSVAADAGMAGFWPGFDSKITGAEEEWAFELEPWRKTEALMAPR